MQNRYQCNEGDEFLDVHSADSDSSLLRKIGITALAGLALAGVGSVTYFAHKAVRRNQQSQVEQWNSLTNHIPILIAEGKAGEARALYNEAWEEINSAFKDQGWTLGHGVLKSYTTNLLWDNLSKKAEKLPRSMSYSTNPSLTH